MVVVDVIWSREGLKGTAAIIVDILGVMKDVCVVDIGFVEDMVLLIFRVPKEMGKLTVV